MRLSRNGWFPHFSPSGKIASGSGSNDPELAGIWVEGLRVDTVGLAPHWIDDDRIVYNIDTAHRVMDTRTRAFQDFLPGASHTPAGGGKFAAWLAQGQGVFYLQGTHHSEGMDAPWITPTGDIVWAAPYQSVERHVYRNRTQITGVRGTYVDVRAVGDLVTWSTYVGVRKRATHGWRRITGLVDLHVLDAVAREEYSEFLSVPVITSRGAFVVTATHYGLFIHAWGENRRGWVYRGEFFNHDVWSDGDNIYVVGSASNGVPLLATFPVASSTVDIVEFHRQIVEGGVEPKPLCTTEYLDGELGSCTICGHLKSKHKIKEPPVADPTLTDEQFATLVRVRGEYPAATLTPEEIGAILNKTAWIHRNDPQPLRLQEKKTGTAAIQPKTGTKIWNGIRLIDSRGDHWGGDICGGCSVGRFTPQRAVFGRAEADLVIDPVDPGDIVTEPDPTILERLRELEQVSTLIYRNVEELQRQVKVLEAWPIITEARVRELIAEHGGGDVDVTATVREVLKKLRVEGTVQQGGPRFLSHTHGLTMTTKLEE